MLLNEFNFSSLGNLSMDCHFIRSNIVSAYDDSVSPSLYEFESSPFDLLSENSLQ